MSSSLGSRADSVDEPGARSGDASTSIPDELVNLRDVAGATPGLVAGMLLRSDAPIEGDGPPASDWWPPRTVLDLRGPGERRGDHPLRGDAEVIEIPLLGRPASAASSQPPASRTWPDRLVEVYLRLLEPPLAAGLVQAVTVVADAEPPVLVHCTAGKDRTGVTVGVILRLLDVPPDVIAAEYALTGPAMPAVLARMHGSVARMTEGAALATTLPPHIAAAPAEAMVEFLEALDAHAGGALGWFRANGGQEETVGRLRRRLLGDRQAT